MGEHINKPVNVSIYYPEKVPSYWEYISGQAKEVRVNITVTEIPDEMRGDYMKDRDFKIAFQELTEPNLAREGPDAGSISARQPSETEGVTVQC